MVRINHCQGHNWIGSGTCPQCAPPPNASDLVARLRDTYEGCPAPVTVALVSLLREAADALAKRDAEIAELKRPRPKRAKYVDPAASVPGSCPHGYPPTVRCSRCGE